MIGVVGCHPWLRAYDDAALLNFLANGWLETHTPFTNSTFAPHRYLHATHTPHHQAVKPSVLCQGWYDSILAIVDLTVVLTVHPRILPP